MKHTTATTAPLVGPLQHAAVHFNAGLFNGQLPPHVVTLQRSLRTESDFLPDRWQDASSNTLHEIALNPLNLAHMTLLELVTALVRQQCHLWQFVHGTPSRAGYHNLEWSEKMASLGLKVQALEGSSHRRTGQRVTVSPIPHGPFLSVCSDLVRQGFGIKWIDRGFPADAKAPSASLAGTHLDSVIRARLNARLGSQFTRLTSLRDAERDAAKRKVKYRCAACQANVWGRNGLTLVCGNCKQPYRRVA